MRTGITLARDLLSQPDYHCTARKWHAGALLIVLLVGGWLRLGGITEVGVRYDDEAAYVMDARLWHRCARLMMDPAAIGATLEGDKKAVKQRMAALGIDFDLRYRKPCQGYTFLGALMMFAVGDDPAALLALNALAGTLALVVVYELATLWLGRLIGLAAALILAVSPYHLVYCRTALADATASLFVLVGVLAWAVAHQRPRVWSKAYLIAGAALGYAAICHIRTAYVAPVLFLLEAWQVVRSTNTAPPAVGQAAPLSRRWLRLALGFAVPIVAIETCFWTARLAVYLADAYLPLPTMLEIAWFNVNQELRLSRPALAGPVNLGAPAAYARFFLHWHGIAAATLGIIGLVALLRFKTTAKAAAILVVAPIIILTGQHFVMARAPSSAVPLMCLCVAVGIGNLVKIIGLSGPSKAVVAVCLVAVTMITAVPQAWAVHGKRSHLEQACAFVQRREGAILVPFDTCHRSKYLLYLNAINSRVVRRNVHRLGSPGEVLGALRREGVRWVMTDPQVWHLRDPYLPKALEVFWWWHGFNRELARSAVLAAEFPHLSNYRWEFLAEGSGVDLLPDMVQKNGGPLRIYDIASGQATPDPQRTGATVANMTPTGNQVGG